MVKKMSRQITRKSRNGDPPLDEVRWHTQGTVVVIVIENGLGDPISNPGGGFLHFI